MPWCDGCDRYFNPNTVHDDGTCPTCGTELATPGRIRRARAGRGSSADAQLVRADLQQPTQGGGSSDDPALGDSAPQDRGLGEDAPRAPWHFWLLLVALVIYLGYRLYEGVLWLGQQL